MKEPTRHDPWKSLRNVVHELRNGGWFTVGKLVDAINRHERLEKVDMKAVRDAVDIGESIGVFSFRFTEDRTEGEWAWIDYTDDTPIIQQAIEKHVDNNRQLRDRKREATESDVSEIIYVATALTGKSPKDIEKSVRELFSKYLIERDTIYSERS